MSEHLHSQISKLVSEIRQDSLDIKCTTETLRYLRNLCATDKLSQIKVGEDKDCVDLMCVLFDKILERPASDENIICLRVGCQFIGNLIVDNCINQLQVHNKCFDHIRKLMLFGDEKLSHFCAMILYNIILSHPDACQDILKEDDLLKAILCQDSEFATFLIEKLLLQNGEIERLYTNCDGLDGQVMLLAMLREQTAAGNTSVPEKCIRFIADTFKRQSDRILKIVSTYVESLDPKEICLLLETLASLSGDSPYLEMLQADHSLFINCAFLLRSIHEAGKTGNNYFTIVKKLPEENSKSRENPVYGFKADLIRLLGNLCYRHDTNKNQIRELECIPILLDCCNIDDSNPFILQWSILALKNISEKNHENQAIIAGLARKDVAHSPILEELGYTMHSEDGKGIRIAPLKRP